tara:strand:- start:42 stop:233 length:192 start_codon:yes stop_codon:yes gene_type:complete
MAHPSEIINTKRHPFVGIRWPVTGSKGNEYTVTMRDSGFDCSCIAFRKCKHIKEVEKRIVGED